MLAELENAENKQHKNLKETKITFEHSLPFKILGVDERNNEIKFNVIEFARVMSLMGHLSSYLSA